MDMAMGMGRDMEVGIMLMINKAGRQEGRKAERQEGRKAVGQEGDGTKPVTISRHPVKQLTR